MWRFPDAYSCALPCAHFLAQRILGKTCGLMFLKRYGGVQLVMQHIRVFPKYMFKEPLELVFFFFF